MPHELGGEPDWLGAGGVFVAVGAGEAAADAAGCGAYVADGIEFGDDERM